MTLVLSNRRRLLLALRRRVQAYRHFDVLDLEEGRVQLTCRTCGAVTIETPGDGTKTGSVEGPGARLLAHWWATGNGVSGICKACTEAERDERYPLPLLDKNPRKRL